MNNRVREYTFNYIIYMRYLKRDGEVKCLSCGKELRVGDRVVSKNRCSHHGPRTSLRCISCARRLNIV